LTWLVAVNTVLALPRSLWCADSEGRTSLSGTFTAFTEGHQHRGTDSLAGTEELPSHFPKCLHYHVASGSNFLDVWVWKQFIESRDVKASRPNWFWPRPRPWPQVFGLGLGLGLKHLVSFNISDWITFNTTVI